MNNSNPAATTAKSPLMRIHTSDALLLLDGLCRPCGHCHKFRKKRSQPLCFRGESLSFTCVFWFLIFSVPTGILMNRIGRKSTVLVSLVITAVSLVIPVFGDSYAVMLISFSLLGIGNAVMRTSLNPLVTNLISGNKLASALTFGQFVKAIASFLAPIIATWGATTLMPTFGLSWRVLFPHICHRERAGNHRSGCNAYSRENVPTRLPE